MCACGNYSHNQSLLARCSCCGCSGICGLPCATASRGLVILEPAHGKANPIDRGAVSLSWSLDMRQCVILFCIRESIRPS
ncbi:hypothetical protein I7I53_07060 [Histoplasma capsulatum var. duboisii H88]|uniref:Uncharacterized protein n=1 Tax=Ajellomyces capsulatus (strain H88) TaxID=544711 RepID=A0A8A1LD28_AJEC8|nr:hypothetical protein I7I53_07060 [Histoplasma capsulatum var. duboisii H88]